MSTVDQTTQPFRLSQLIYDTRYRSLTIQVIAAILMVSLIAFLASNVVYNLAEIDRDPDFGFLTQRAGYDIGFSLIEADSSSTHARMALAGLLNTLLVSFLGCLLATIIGVLVGVLRLSKNWVVSRLMAVYVDGFRNVPLLLWILLIFAIMTEATPAPRDFRPGDNGTPEAMMKLWDTVAITNRGTYVPAPVFETLGYVVMAIFVASIIGVFLWRRYARQQLFDHGRMVPVGLPALGILILPTVIAFFVLGRPISLEYPELGGFNFNGGVQIPNSLLALWLALSLYTGAFIAELVRAGILAVDKGQTEASAALGIKPSRTMSLVILPQALRVIIPPVISQFLNLTKNSSLAIAVTYPDIRATLGGTAITTTGKELEGMLLLGLAYLLISLAISSVGNWFNARAKLKER